MNYNGCHGNQDFYIAQSVLFLETTLFRILGLLRNNLTLMENVLEGHGRLNWSPGY